MVRILFNFRIRINYLIDSESELVCLFYVVHILTGTLIYFFMNFLGVTLCNNSVN